MNMFIPIVNYFLLTIGFIGFVRNIWPWYRAYKLYGYMPFTLLRQLLSYTSKSLSANVITLGKFLFTIWGGFEILHLAEKVPQPPHLMFLALTILLVNRLGLLILPPAILFLSSSSSKAAQYFSFLSYRLWPFRVVALLRPLENWSSSNIRGWFFRGCLRTGNDYEWRTIVFHLMDVVPLIVIDSETETSGVREEWCRIKAKGYLDRTIQFQNIDSPDLPKLILDRLNKTNDQQKRKKRQSEFNRVLLWLPSYLRYNRSLYTLVLRSRVIGQQEYERYLRKCKGITPSQIAGRLIEDIPSIVSVADEEHFLQSSRGYEEVEILLKSALEDVQKVGGINSNYNIGNCLNNLGKFARSIHRWDEAINYLTSAIKHFESSTSETDEIATAYYLLGEVYMAQFRTSGSNVEKMNAIKCFTKSAKIDNSVGHDTSATNKLLIDIQSDPEPDNESLVTNSQLPEPMLWESPIVVRFLSLVAGFGTFIPLAYLIGWLLGLQSEWFSFKGWKLLIWWQQLLVNLGAGMGSLFVGTFVYAVLTRRKLND